MDAYTLPKISTLVNKVSQNKCYSSMNLTSVYYQVKILDFDKPYTAFKENGKLY